jgi:hypothetical protein
VPAATKIVGIASINIAPQSKRRGDKNALRSFDKTYAQPRYLSFTRRKAAHHAML